VGHLAATGITANQVTVLAAALSIVLGAALAAWHEHRLLFLAVPIWLALRMALNAIDGMLAREFGQESRLRGHLNELGDVVSGAALYAPFALVPPFGPTGIFMLIFLATLSELAGILGPAVGASRRYDGPLGKSDRALVFGALGFWVALATLPAWAGWLVP